RRAAIVGHAVDRARAADDLAARQRHLAAAEVRLRHGRKAPAELRVHDGGADGGRDADIRMPLGAAGLDDGDAVLAVRREPRREHATGRAGADDYVVELAIEILALAQGRDSFAGNLGAASVVVAQQRMRWVLRRGEPPHLFAPPPDALEDLLALHGQPLLAADLLAAPRFFVVAVGAKVEIGRAHV